MGWRSYRFDVPNGNYLVRLHFAEVDPPVQGAKQRVFDLSIQGVPVFVDFDLAAIRGIQYGTEYVQAVRW